MQEKVRFCCVCCGNMLGAEEASIIFRTGFFKVVHPLGCCKMCLASVEVAASLEAPEPWDGEREASVVMLPSHLDPRRFDRPLTEPAAVYPMVVSL